MDKEIVIMGRHLNKLYIAMNFIVTSTSLSVESTLWLIIHS